MLMGYREELLRFFDEQVLAIFKLIDGQIQRASSANPREQIVSLAPLHR